MATQILTPEQIEKLSEVKSPVLRRRFTLYYQLPKDLQESMFADQTTSNIWSIIKEKHGLAEENISVVAKVIGLVMLGEVPIKEFIQELSRELNLPKNKTAIIARDINQSIFQPVRDSLMEVHGVNNKTAHTKAVANKKDLPKEYHGGVSLNELEKINPAQARKIQPAKEETGLKPIPMGREALPTPDNHPANKIDEATTNKQDELIEKLKRNKQQHRVARPPTTQQKVRPEPKIAKSQTRPRKENMQKKSGPAEATTVAWNGRTIDLRKIPPRRSSPKREN